VTSYKKQIQKFHHNYLVKKSPIEEATNPLNMPRYKPELLKTSKEKLLNGK
jgi:hypothetical protein